MNVILLSQLAVDAKPEPTGPAVWAGPRGVGLSHLLVWRVGLQDPSGPAVWVGEIDAQAPTEGLEALQRRQLESLREVPTVQLPVRSA